MSASGRVVAHQSMVGANPNIAAIVLAESAHKVANKPLFGGCVLYFAIRRYSPKATVPAAHPNVVLAVLVYGGDVCVVDYMAQFALGIAIKTSVIGANPQTIAAVASHRLN